MADGMGRRQRRWDDVWTTTMEWQHQKRHQDDSSNGRQEGDDDVWHQKHDVRSMMSEWLRRQWRWHCCATSGRWCQECDGRTATMMTAETSRHDVDNDSWDVMSRRWHNNSWNVMSRQWRRRLKCDVRTVKVRMLLFSTRQYWSPSSPENRFFSTRWSTGHHLALDADSSTRWSTGHHLSLDADSSVQDEVWSPFSPGCRLFSTRWNTGHHLDLDTDSSVQDGVLVTI